MQSSSATVMTGSNFSYDTDAMMCEKQSDDDNLENLRKKVSSLTSSNSKTSTYSSNATINKTRKQSSFENNNNDIDSDDDDDKFHDEKKFSHSARIKRFVLFF
jgi:hypothetical protein